MRVGLTLAGEMVSEDGARFAAQLGVNDVVVHLTDYARGGDQSAYLNGEAAGPAYGDSRSNRLWTYDDFTRLNAMLASYGLRCAALENFAPNFWNDILLDGPKKREQMDDLKRVIRDAGRAGIPIFGYNFSIAGVWGWMRKPIARGGATTVVFDIDAFDADAPIPDGVVWNMRYRDAIPNATPITVSDAELWERFAWFLRELVPVAEEAGVMLAAHPDDPPAETLRGTARLVNTHAKYDRLIDLVDSPANGLEFCIGSLAEMPDGDIYETTRHFARLGKIAYVHFRNVAGKMPRYRETFVDDGDVDMAEIVNILREENFDGVMVPDHVPELACPAPWHAGHAYTVGYMKALVAHSGLPGPSRRAHTRPEKPQRIKEHATH
ncbi:MAG TPA: mannonate dehydratase [Bauldia sp.]|nr:mannonate dehydratase [Bauldia sp.]